MSQIHLKGITKRFGKVLAVNNVDLKVNDGEFLTILGPSGSGKTTLLTMIAGFEEPTSGNIEIGDRDVTHYPAHKRDVGLVFQNYALFPHLSVFKNVAFPLSVRKVPKNEIEPKVTKALELVNMERFKERKPNELSGGQQQRVALARAFVFEPSILLLDEPLAALDRKLRQKVQVEIKELQRSLGITAITVTHDQEEALTMSDRMLIVRDGNIEQLGTPKDLYNNPKNRFVANFLGTANLFDGTIKASGEEVFLNFFKSGNTRIPKSFKTEASKEACVMLRPEQIKLKSSDNMEGFSGVVVSVVYLGNEYRYYINSDIGDNIIVTEVDDQQRWSVGEKIKFSWDLSKQRILFN